MSFGEPKHRETRPGERSPDNQRTVFIDELGREITHVWPGLRAERINAADGLPARLVVTKHESATGAEIGCEFDGETGWWFTWLRHQKQPQRLVHVKAVQ